MTRGLITRGGEFDFALLGDTRWLSLPDGTRQWLPVERWRGAPSAADEVMLRACHGPVLDVGCGPGRLTAALTTRGVRALGVDSSPVAVRLTRSRGALALRRDVFDRLPGEGRWRQLLLADGNIGIGGDPGALLRRAGALLSPGGTVLVEVDPPGMGLRRGRVRLGSDQREGAWFAWAWVGADAVGRLAAATGFVVEHLVEHSARWFAELRRS